MTREINDGQFGKLSHCAVKAAAANVVFTPDKYGYSFQRYIDASVVVIGVMCCLQLHGREVGEQDGRKEAK